MTRHISFTSTAIAALSLTGGAALADSIDPLTFDATLLPGESVTIKKTVTIDEEVGDPLIDTFFVIDTSGSMTVPIDDAKTAAGALLAGLEDFGDNASGVGVYSESSTGDTNAPPGAWINLDITPTEATAAAAIGAVTLGVPDGGGDFPERGQDAVAHIAETASWRPGSNRFIFALGDAAWKNDLTSDADAITALTDNNVTLVGLRFNPALSSPDPDSDDETFNESVEDLGGTVFAGGTSPDDIIDAVTAGLIGSFEDYSEVTVDDLLGGLPGVSVSTTCTMAAPGGICVGADAIGDYDRSEPRVFMFDVTFTNVGLEPGDSVTFPTFALVDGGIVAREIDTIAAVPLPAALWLLLGGLGGLAAFGRRRA